MVVFMHLKAIKVKEAINLRDNGGVLVCVHGKLGRE